MKTICAVIILFFSCIGIVATAQTPYWQWAKSISGTDYAQSISTDAYGSVYVTGYYQSTTVTFGSNTLTNNSNTGGSNIFIAKYDATGNVIWAKSAGGTGSDYGLSISTDAFGNVYVTGEFYSPTIIFGSNTLTNNSNTGGSNIFIAKYDATGNIIWAKSSGNGVDGGTGISTDANGSVYITGGSPVFVVKYDSTGNVIWAQSAGGTALGDFGYGISTDGNDNVYITGAFQSPTITFGSTTLTNNTSGNNPNFFIVKYDATGNVIWAKSGSGAVNEVDYGQSISTDALGNVYVTGVFVNPTISFGGDTLTNSEPNGGDDIFVIKYDLTGNVIWAKSAGGMGNDKSNGISTDASGNIYVTGYYTSPTITFGSNTLINNTNTGEDIFVVKYDATGNVIWAIRADATMNDAADDIGQSITTDAFGNVYVTGASSGSDGFVAKIANCILPSAPTNTTATSEQIICAGNNTTLTATGTGTLAWYSADSSGIYLGGNSSFVTSALTANTTFYVQDSTCGASPRTAITITVHPKPTATITLTGNDTLTTGAFATYQWLINGTVINIATQQLYSADSNGNYQVIVTDTSGCSDTSGIYNFTTLGIAVVNQPGNISIYPNPSNGNVYFNGVKAGNTIEVYNLLGKIIYTSKATTTNYCVTLTGKAKGIYFYRIIDNTTIIQQGKIIVE
jgi:hypothetical protein